MKGADYARPQEERRWIAGVRLDMSYPVTFGLLWSSMFPGSPSISIRKMRTRIMMIRHTLHHYSFHSGHFSLTHASNVNSQPRDS